MKAFQVNSGKTSAYTIEVEIVEDGKVRKLTAKELKDLKLNITAKNLSGKALARIVNR